MYKSYCNYYGIEADILVPSLLKQFRLRGITEIDIPTMPGASAFQDSYVYILYFLFIPCYVK